MIINTLTLVYFCYVFFKVNYIFKVINLLKIKEMTYRICILKKEYLNFLPVFKVVEIPSEWRPLTKKESAFADGGEFGKIR